MRLICIYLFGKDFYHRRNPTYPFSTIGEKYNKIIKITNEKIILAFRLEDEFNDFYN